MWSPGLIPKPADWGPEIDIAGFVFLELAASFKPPETLTKFLDAGEPPVYIGFGSIVVDDPDKFTSLIFAAVKKAGIRALVSKGWGGLGDEGNTPDNIYMLENTPHDWLFPRVSAVVHHGGAGTTAIGLKCGKPTLIVPFFGDQPFWGAMVARAGAGAHAAIPYKELTADKLAEGIQECLSPEAKEHAQEIARDIAAEGDGASNAVKSFHRSLPLRGEHSMRCSILEDHVAVWQLKRINVRISALAADILVAKKKIKWHDLRLIRHHEWNDFEGPGEPITGGGAALASSLAGVAKGVGGTPFRWAKRIKKKEQHDRMKKERQGAEVAKKSTSERIPSPPKQNGHPAGQKESPGDLPHGGNHQVDGGAVGPRVSRQGGDRNAEESDTSEGNIAEEIVADAGAGLVETGEALAKGDTLLHLRALPSHSLTLENSTYGYSPSYLARLSQRSSALRRQNCSQTDPRFWLSFRTPCRRRRIRLRYLRRLDWPRTSALSWCPRGRTSRSRQGCRQRHRRLRAQGFGGDSGPIWIHDEGHPQGDSEGQAADPFYPQGQNHSGAEGLESASHREQRG